MIYREIVCELGLPIRTIILVVISLNDLAKLDEYFPYFFLQVFMYRGGITFSISKSFGRLQLVPETNGLRLFFSPIANNAESPSALGSLDMLIPIDAIGGLWATTRAFLYGVESLDESVALENSAPEGDAETVVKLYRDRPRGQHGKLSGEEMCWLRIVTGRTEAERKRIKLGPRDLLCLELACNSVMILAGNAGTHRPSLG